MFQAAHRPSSKNCVCGSTLVVVVIEGEPEEVDSR